MLAGSDCGAAMIEKRRVRFADIEGIGRSDLLIASEVWVDDISRQPWATRDIIKLATLLKRYMTAGEPKDMLFRSIERISQLDRNIVVESLRQMQMLGVVEAYVVDGEVVRVSLRLSMLQRLRVLEARRRFQDCGIDTGQAALNARDGASKWIPGPRWSDEVPAAPEFEQA